MKLNKKNYFTPKNRYLSNSKLGDWLKSKEYFYGRHVTNTIVKPETEALILGKACDIWLTKSRKAFEKEYLRVKRRSSKITGFVQLSERQYDQVVKICESVEKTSAFKEFKKGKKQVILQMDKKIGMFEGLCGIPDVLHFDKKMTSCTIDDLKTAKTVDSKKYHFHCLEYGYYRQQAVYQILIEATYGISKFTSRHLVVEKDSDGIYKVKTFILSQARIEEEKKKVWQILEDIAKEKTFKDKDVSFADAEVIGEPEVETKISFGESKWKPTKIPSFSDTKPVSFPSNGAA